MKLNVKAWDDSAMPTTEGTGQGSPSCSSNASALGTGDEPVNPSPCSRGLAKGRLWASFVVISYLWHQEAVHDGPDADTGSGVSCSAQHSCCR